MIDFLYTHKPLIKTSNYHQSCDIVSEVDEQGSTEKKVKGNPLFDRTWRIKLEKYLSCTLDDGDPE